ncbi:hypothetical protein CGQ24_06005 [Arthrobacter sp. 7749]|nr:hypothetical protein CGQ24_06005 [Arthrobacter sp. 7749]
MSSHYGIFRRPALMADVVVLAVDYRRATENSRPVLSNRFGARGCGHGTACRCRGNGAFCRRTYPPIMILKKLRSKMSLYERD